METIIALIAFLLIPIFAVLIDGIGMLASLRKKYIFSFHRENDFTVLVPIYGKVDYLENVDFLKEYGHKVILCTTGDESPQFYRELHVIAHEHNFRIFIDTPKAFDRAAQDSKNERATSGTTRDTLIRNVLLTQVTSKYVIPIDADTRTKRHLSYLVGELVRHKFDIASIKIVLTNPRESFLTKMQYFEYYTAMRLRLVAPYMVSGACHVAKTEVLREIMSRHSLFFQGNDMEVGILAYNLKYNIGHIPFEVFTAAPAKFRPWFRQRLAWSGGEFRLFVTNYKFVLQHPLIWFYGGIVVILLFPLRWYTLFHPSWVLISIFSLYYLLVIFIHWKHKNVWLLLLPIYSLFLSLCIAPIGVFTYIHMVHKHKNYGLIKPKRDISQFSLTV